MRFSTKKYITLLAPEKIIAIPENGYVTINKKLYPSFFVENDIGNALKFA